jgi:hypothetical protein
LVGNRNSWEIAVPQKITVHVDDMVRDAEGEIETLNVTDALKLHGRDDVVFVDLRDIRELARDGRVPEAFHCPRGMLEFWIDPMSKYHKPVRPGQAVCVFLCRRRTVGARRAGRPAHGIAPGCPYPRRLRGLEGSRRRGGDGGARKAKIRLTEL